MDIEHNFEAVPVNCYFMCKENVLKICYCSVLCVFTEKKAESLDNRENLKLQDGEAPIKKRKYTKRNKGVLTGFLGQCKCWILIHFP